MLPLNNSHFRVDFMGNKAFNDAVVTFKVNLQERLIEIGLYETRDCAIFPIIMATMWKENLSLTWDAMTPSDATVLTIFYHDLKISDHSFEQSYNSHQGAAAHRLVFSFEGTKIL